MVGRSKPKPKEPPLSGSFADAELVYIKAKNTELAKAVANNKQAYAEMVIERDYLQRELFTANLKISTLRTEMGNIQRYTKMCLDKLVGMTNDCGQILHTTSNCTKVDAQKSPDASIKPVALQKTPNPTNVVKPMIDGHVIFRPTVALRRISDIIPMEQMERLPANLIQSAIVDCSDNGSNVQEQRGGANESLIGTSVNAEDFIQAELSPGDQLNAAGQNGSNSSDFSSNEPFPRLDTIDEVTEQTIVGSHVSTSVRHSQVPILSGYYTDVRVYMTPDNIPRSRVNYTRGATSKRGPSFTGSSAAERMSPPRKRPHLKSNEVESSEEEVSNNEERSERATKLFLERNNDESNSQTRGCNEDDPLEGPSTLLDVDDKMDTMSISYLTPRKLRNNTSTPQHQSLTNVEKIENVESGESVTENSTPRIFVTDRRKPNFSPQVVLYKLPEVEAQNRNADVSEESVDVLQKEIVKTKTWKRSKKKSDTEKQPATSSHSPKKASFKVNAKKSGKKSSPKRSSPKKAPNRDSTSVSPNKRPKRKAGPSSLKEISLKTKLRRSR